jgi:predicted metalloprotease with PDZ domain
VVFLHTGLHERYHRPADDAAHLNREGMMKVTRLLFAMVYELADRPEPLRFRKAAGQEDERARLLFAQPDPSPVVPGEPPLRLGVSWRVDESEPGTVVLSHVVAGSPAAAAGLHVGDRICRIANRDFSDDTAFTELAKKLPGPLELLVERDGELRLVVLHFPGEASKTKRAA